MGFKGGQGKVERERERERAESVSETGKRTQTGGTFRENPGEIKRGSLRQSYLERLKETAEEKDKKPP